jgi:hypothetical protein
MALSDMGAKSGPGMCALCLAAAEEVEEVISQSRTGFFRNPKGGSQDTVFPPFVRLSAGFGLNQLSRCTV